jgi:hypothetical protein
MQIQTLLKLVTVLVRVLNALYINLIVIGIKYKTRKRMLKT